MLRSLLSKGVGVACVVPVLSLRDERHRVSLTQLLPDMRWTSHCDAAIPTPSNHNPDVAIISGTTCVGLSEKISKELSRPLSAARISQFSDGESFVDIQESMRGVDCLCAAVGI
jgi:hypothetical protein